MENRAKNIYETDALVSQYCEFQYGNEYLGVENFAKVCAQKAIAYSVATPQRRALDLGCATGRASFELAKVFEHVTGIDYSQAFIDVAREIQRDGCIAYTQNGEGVLKQHKEVSLASLGLSAIAEKIEFVQGDACDLMANIGEYDLIMATNLIDRLYEPKLFLNTIHTRIKDEGYLVLTSPYTWMEEYTAKEFWIGGYYDSKGNEVSTLEGLKAILNDHFDLVEVEDVPFVIRETPRKYQYTLSQMSVWKRKQR
jgi:putative 4-mercaptohistidine N1-methyltranferase